MKEIIAGTLDGHRHVICRSNLLQQHLHRIKKLNRILSAIPEYIKTKDIDPTPCMCQEHMSDEASGPEDEGVESKEDWKMRMATAYGMKDPTPLTIGKLKFLEKIEPEWRSKRVSFYSFQQITDEVLTTHSSLIFFTNYTTSIQPIKPRSNARKSWESLCPELGDRRLNRLY
jgi:hypothetical protein